jgi:hypothetical protein
MSIKNDNLYKKINRILLPIKKPDENTKYQKDYEFKCIRLNSKIALPQYYLIYFLFIDYLHFQNLGRYEKVAWAIPIDYMGSLYTIEYRKFGIGIFGLNAIDADEIVKRIKKAVKVAEPYYESIAKGKIESENLNVINNSSSLFSRYLYFVKLYNEKVKINSKLKVFEGYQSRQEEAWLALSAIDSFFSWTEQIFIHIGILSSYLKIGTDVINFADLDWKSKYKQIILLKTKDEKICYDKLSNIKDQLRNFYAHGAFGKTGETFEFHSSTGAIPLNITCSINNNKEYSLHGPEGFRESDALKLIEHFINDVLWVNGRKPAKMYLMESGLPTILTHANDGVYEKAMSGVDEMKDFLLYLSYTFDNAANMDW